MARAQASRQSLQATFGAKWAFAVLAVALGGALWGARARSTPAAGAASSVTKSQARGNALLVSPAPGRSSTIGSALLPAGSDRSYRARYTTSVVAGNGVRVASFTLTGQLKLVGLTSSKGRVIGGEFQGMLTGVGAAEAGGESERTLGEAARRPFLLEFADDGRFQAVRGAAGVPPFIGRIWQALGEYLQVVRQPGESWRQSESDAIGSYLAAYQVDGSSVVKRKLHYENVKASKVKGYEVRRYEGRFRFDVPPALESLVLREGLIATVADGPFATFDSTTELSLEATTPLQPSAEAAWASRLATAEPLKAAVRPRPHRMTSS